MQIDCFVAHLNVADVAPGDTVIGTLPIHLAAEICAKKAKFVFLALPQTLEGRGSEYTLQDMREMGA
ncbi:CRISPR-associated protein Csx16 [Neisseria sp. CCUG17229]|uniref:CRISPR-associated protein Csx16 n=1 Tax=Neisseria sp. CCUG17229 TaxID=3392036 RepID=UPI003A0FFCC3